MSNDIHDTTFKELLCERSFFIPLFKTYLPTPLAAPITWKDLDFYKMDGTHIQEKTKGRRSTDVLYLAPLKSTGKDKNSMLLWLHLEHQSSFDKLLPLRLINYQTGILLDYAKANNSTQLPPIVGLIIYHGKTLYPQDWKVEDLIVSAPGKEYLNIFFLSPGVFQGERCFSP